MSLEDILASSSPSFYITRWWPSFLWLLHPESTGSGVEKRTQKVADREAQAFTVLVTSECFHWDGQGVETGSVGQSCRIWGGSTLLPLRS